MLAVFAWPQGGGGGGGGPLNAIAAAAERTQAQPGGRATMWARVTPADSSEPFTMTGEILYGDAGEAGTMEFPSPETGEMEEMEVVMKGTMMYMRSDSFGALPDDREWIGIDVSFGGELFSTPTSADPKGELAMLESVTGVRKLGKAALHGVPTTHYGGVVSVSEQAARLRDEGAERMASWTEENGSPARIEVWIDSAEMVRRIRLVQSKPNEDGEGVTKIDMRMDFSSFGSVPEIEVPDEAEVFDATSKVERQFDSSTE